MKELAKGHSLEMVQSAFNHRSACLQLVPQFSFKISQDAEQKYSDNLVSQTEPYYSPPYSLTSVFSLALIALIAVIALLSSLPSGREPPHWFSCLSLTSSHSLLTCCQG